MPNWKAHPNRTKSDSSRNRHQGSNDSSGTSTKKSIDTYVPKTNLGSLQTLFYQYFNTVRSAPQDLNSGTQTFLNLKRTLRKKFLDLGLVTGIQQFNITKTFPISV